MGLVIKRFLGIIGTIAYLSLSPCQAGADQGDPLNITPIHTEIVKVSSSAVVQKPRFERRKIPVLMYHQFPKSEKNDRLNVSLSHFEMQLEKLYNAGYSLISLKDYYNEDYSHILQGRKPLLITMDDGWESQVIFKDGSLSPACGLGVLRDFSDKHKDFNYDALFFISFDKIPFGQREYVDEKFDYLLKNGLEVGNHTKNHLSEKRMDEKSFMKDVAGGYNKLEDIVGKDNVQNKIPIISFAYPYGDVPKNLDYINDYNKQNPPIKIAFTTGYSRPGSKYENFLIGRIEATDRAIEEICKKKF